MTSKKLQKILVVRNDKLGDFMLSFPAFRLLKNSLPDSTIVALVPSYTKDMAEACEWIDEIIIDEWQNSGFFSNFKLSQDFRKFQFDAIISLYSTTRVGVSALLARIPYRLAPATKLAQIFYNHRLVQRRSRSEKPEYAYNSDLIKYLCKDNDIPIQNSMDPPYLQFDLLLVEKTRNKFCNTYGISEDSFLIFIHAGSGGSARNLSANQYASLASKLTCQKPYTIVLSAGPGEYENAHQIAKQLINIPHIVYESRQGLKQFAQHIQFADLFIGGSTGPVHVAGALDRPTVAFYPRRQSATALRWQTLNHEDNRQAFSPPLDADEEDMSKIDIEKIAEEISRKFLSH
ncbi:MAG: glycosyltransferase family 9 protein [Gammaproteobacteria bacterium]|nr:glycosyltransferase family 9 protein [Gammaproteobacteria bacterium]